MNKYEIEVLREKLKELRKKAERKREAGHSLVAEGMFLAIDIFKPAIDSLPAPDDGLREGLEEIFSQWGNEIYNNDKQDNQFIDGMQKCFSDIAYLLAHTPDPWKLIADAPRDGRPILFRDKAAGTYIQVAWEDRYKEFTESATGSIVYQESYSHYRELPAPPREEET